MVKSWLVVLNLIFFCNVLVVSLHTNVAEGICQNDHDFEVGDLVEFDFMGETREGEVTRFTGTGWPYVEFEYRGKTTERFFPPNRLTFLETTESENAAVEFRSWTDATGKFSVKAQLISNQNGKVELRKEDGRIVTLAISKLSELDQRHLADLAKKIADEANEENPFAGGVIRGEKGSERLEPKRRAKPRRTGPTAIEPEFGTNELSVSASSWTLKPDPAANSYGSKKIINSKVRSDRMSSIRTFVATIPGAPNIVGMIGGPFDNSSSVSIFDLNSGTSHDSTIDQKGAKLFAASPDGNTIVTKLERRGTTSATLQFWDTSGDTAKLISVWKMAEFANRIGFDPKWGALLSDGQLLTFGRRIVLWDCERATDAYTLDLQVSEQAAFSLGGKQFACITRDGIYLVETLTGKVLGKLDTFDANPSALSFSDSGQFLAATDRASAIAIIWDLDTGEKVVQFSLPHTPLRSVNWVGDKYLLVNDTMLVDIALQTAVWKYNSDHRGKVVRANDGGYWYFTAGKLTPLDLVINDLEIKTAQLDPDALLVLKPGDAITLNIDLPFSPSESDDIRNTLAMQIESKGFVLQDGAKTSLNVSVKKLKREKMEVSSITDPFGHRGRETIEFTPSFARVSIERDGQELWKRSRRFGPSRGGVITAKQGETMQQAAKRMCQPAPEFFSSATIPSHIRKLPEGVMGESKITSSGMR